MDIEIPDKLYFKIGEVAELTGIKPHVLRYWESEFGVFRPAKSQSKQRLYRRKDIELVLYLKDLLYRQGFTIAGARKKLREDGPVNISQMSLPLAQTPQQQALAELREDLKRLRDSLSTSGKPD
ncbi:MerR family transcriptional regulator [Desulfuromonas versatilis]|uniref:MerR family transcriptional regulator n=1 Tax=Desulfuromonas versatilis TaxID=2802975 RepID=A0ABM8HWZ6_9BACT|nr:MerR family transcriptional regulator [Desulfuromonas versatilis]BCR05101.1 MerR family transcriptional regulator [Desulfuromonas versatilis]